MCIVCTGPMDFSAVAGVKGRMAHPAALGGKRGGPVEIDIGGIGLTAIAGSLDSSLAREGYDLVFLVCGMPCARHLCLLWAADNLARGIEVPEPGPPPLTVVGLRLKEPGTVFHPGFIDAYDSLLAELKRLSPHALEQMNIDESELGPIPADVAECFLLNHCAWCTARIDDNDPVQSVFATLTGDDDLPQGVVAIPVGERQVPAFVVEPGSEASALGQIAFMLCSTRCAASLRAAIAEDRRLSLVH